MPRTKKYLTEDVGRLMKEHDGNYAKVATDLGTSEKYMRRYVQRNPQLRAIWIASGDAGSQPTDSELLVRDSPPPEPDNKLLDALDKNGKEAFMSDIGDMLHNPENIEKLAIFESFDDSVGQLMGEALKLTQKIAIRQNMSLFEVAEKLRDDIQGGRLDTEEEIIRTRLFMQATEQQGKFYDRILHGLDLMLKMTEREKGEKKRKPGFRPLKEMQGAEDKKN
jgi:hypothetical protein